MNTERRERLIEIFEDTLDLFTESEKLSEAIEKSCAETRFYGENEAPSLAEIKNDKDGIVTVSKGRTFEAAMRYAKKDSGKKIAVLNFASATYPGGGVDRGASAQEECLCRCSTLYPTLDQNRLHELYYKKNLAKDDFHYTDDCIYSPDVWICKTDTEFPERMEEKDWVRVDVITCAAPNLRFQPENWTNPETGRPVGMDPKELYELHVKRTRHILQVAAANHVDILILGAFGCGAFSNDPDIVAKAMNEAVQEYRAYFSVIDFAIYCRKFETENYTAFQKHIKS